MIINRVPGHTWRLSDEVRFLREYRFRVLQGERRLPIRMKGPQSRLRPIDLYLRGLMYRHDAESRVRLKMRQAARKLLRGL